MRDPKRFAGVVAEGPEGPYVRWEDYAGTVDELDGLLKQLRKLLDADTFFLPSYGPERERGLAFLDKLKEAGYPPHEGKKGQQG